MIVLLSCSISLYANNDTIPSTGGQDSILISYDDLRIVNSKLIELKYEQQINKELKSVISNDSIAIRGLSDRILRITDDNARTVRNIKKQRNIASGIGIGAIILLIISIL